MTRLTALVLAGAMTLGGTAQAQQPRRPMGPPNGGPPAGAMMPQPGMGGGPGNGVASMLLAHTGEFKLTDAQVTRLAAIARRTSDRQRAMRASMDSLRASTSATMPAAGAERVPSPAMRAMAERMRDQSHADLRDALSVLTAEQQALGWEMMMARQGGGAPGFARAAMRRSGPGPMGQGGGMGQGRGGQRRPGPGAQQAPPPA